MSGVIAGAILVGSLYNAEQARKANRQAREMQAQQLAMQERDANLLREQINAQTELYATQAASLKDQAETARKAFDASKLQYAENKLSMENKAKEVQAAADEERRKAAAAEASALKARTRGGRRSLLSQERLTPELGVTGAMLGQEMRV